MLQGLYEELYLYLPPSLCSDQKAAFITCFAASGVQATNDMEIQNEAARHALSILPQL